MALDQTHRILPPHPVVTLADHEAAGGGRGLAAARRMGPAATVEEVLASGLRGRGGGGFPTGVKWETVAEHDTAGGAATVIVNGAEGEPGTFKDRTLLRRTPHAVIEGALIAALTVGADRVVLAVKESFTAERERLAAAIAEIEAAGWAPEVRVEVRTGPSAYLFGEETALLEAIAGRPPFPRIAPPFRHGSDELGVDPAEAAGTVMATEGSDGSPPALVNNVETLAHVAALMAEGAAWFREVGTAESPGTLLCTITGDTVRHGVGEVAMGTLLGDAIELIGGGRRLGRQLTSAISGVANPLVPAQLFDTPLTYEHMAAIGGGLGAAGFIVFDDGRDLAGVIAGISRFLAVESCGQCTPCKVDGLEIADRLDAICGPNARPHDLEVVTRKLATVGDGARCYLATQHDVVVRSIVETFTGVLPRHAEGRADPVPVELIAPIVDIADGVAVVDGTQETKQPDWTHDPVSSGKTPVERLTDGSTPA